MPQMFPKVSRGIVGSEPDDIDEAIRVVERWRSKRLKTTLPDITELARIVDSPLLDEEKIPLALHHVEGLVSSTSPDLCTDDDVRLLFRAANGLTPLDRLFFTVETPPPRSEGKESFIFFWDTNVRIVMGLILPEGWCTRNCSDHPATGPLHPDYAFTVKDLCLFRGEEDPLGIGNSKKKLAEKLAWVYDPAPYVLGYYTEGFELTLVAISPPPQGQRNAVVHHIASSNLKLKKGRIMNICRLINLAGVIRSLADLVPPSIAEFRPIESGHGTVEIAGHGVIKSYTDPDWAVRMLRLRNTYQTLKDKQVPHVDSLVSHYHTMAVLSPRGIPKQPETEEDLLNAIVCVLEALEALHKDPPMLHQDIRWANVMRRLDDPLEWFIIDWEDAAMAPAPAQHHFRESNHSPRTFVDGHGTEVDIWGVGELIAWYRVVNISMSPEMRDLGKWMQGSMAPSAREVLDKMKILWPNRVSR